MNPMSTSLVIQILCLIVFFVIASTLATFCLLTHYTKWATKYQLAQVAYMFEDDPDGLEGDEDADVHPLFPR